MSWLRFLALAGGVFGYRLTRLYQRCRPRVRNWLAKLVCHQQGHVYRLRMRNFEILGLGVWWHCPRCGWSSETHFFPVIVPAKGASS